jgi:hypothetical protein
MFDQQAEVIARFDELFERHYPSSTRESAAMVDRICASWRAQNRCYCRNRYFQKAFMGGAYMSLSVSGSRVPGVVRKVSSRVAIRLYSL